MDDGGTPRSGDYGKRALWRSWWHADQFDWLSGYLRARGLERPTRILMAVFSSALMLDAVATVTLPQVPVVVRVAYSVIAVAVSLRYAALWLRAWPTRRQSLALVWLASPVAAVGNLVQPQPMLALIGCAGMLIISGYAAFFHSTKAICISVMFSVVAALVCAVRIASADDLHTAIAGFVVVVELSCAVPLAIQAVVRTLGADVLRSDQDPLTGVLNRRAFYERASTLLSAPGHDLYLVVLMIDLDKFKKLNDEHGHMAGDEALTAVGWALRRTTDGSAIIGRFGGEEFIVIDAVPANVAEQLPVKVCAAIAALPHLVTASVGAAVRKWDGGAAIDDLIRAADEAMYVAKRAGGNRSQIAHLTPSGW